MNSQFRFISMLLLITALACLLVAAPPANAGSSPKPAGYVTLSFASHTVEGEFDGDRTIPSVKGVFSVPNVDPGAGLAVALGVRSGWTGVEAGYWQSSHDVSFGGLAGEASKHSLGIEGRVYGPEWGVISPFVSGGVFWEWLSVDNGYCSDLTGDPCAERFKGFGVSFGPGANLYVTKNLFVVGRVIYRHTDYDAISSTTADEGALAYTLDGNGWTWSTGLGYEF